MCVKEKEKEKEEINKDRNEICKRRVLLKKSTDFPGR